MTFNDKKRRKQKRKKGKKQIWSLLINVILYLVRQWEPMLLKKERMNYAG